MKIEIAETPLSFSLHGKSNAVQPGNYGEVGMKLMDEMWRVVKQSGAAATGINHWVYLSHDRMFVGVELRPNSALPVDLEHLEFQLPRYLRHVHLGPYEGLPQKWTALKNEIARRGEVMASNSLEVYGHHCDDSAKRETTILIGLQAKTA